MTVSFNTFRLFLTILFFCGGLCRAEINQNPKETVYIAANIAGGFGVGFCRPSVEKVRKNPNLTGGDLTASKDWAWSIFGGGYGRAFGWNNAVLGLGLAYYSGFSLRGFYHDSRYTGSASKLHYELQGLHGPGFYISAGIACNKKRDTIHLILGLAKRGARLTMKAAEGVEWESDVTAGGWIAGVRYIKPIYSLAIPISFVFSYEAHGLLEVKTFKTALAKKSGRVVKLPLGGNLRGFATAHYLSIGLLYAF